jgi:hypothetical protein
MIEIPQEVIQAPDGKFVIFWRAWCSLTKRELTFRSHLGTVPTFEEMKVWVDRFFRHYELREVRPWDHEDEKRILFPVPVQNVKFRSPKFELAQPGRRRQSFGVPGLAGSSLLGGRSLI